MNIYDDFEATERQQHSVQPVQSGWALQAAALIDEQCPGFLIALLRSKGAKRHAMLAVLATSLGQHLDQINCTSPLCPRTKAALKALGEMLPTMKPRAAMETAFHLSSFEGLGTLDRLLEPLEPGDYIELVQVLSDPAERRRQQLLQYTPHLDHDRLRGILALDPALCHVRFAKKVRREDQAKLANDVLTVVRQHRPDLSSQELFDFCGQADQYAPLQAHLERLLELVKELPEPTFEVPHGFRHLRTKKDFEDCGQRFRNCIATKFLPEALPGRVTYLEFIPRPAIAALLPTSAGLMLSKVHAPKNSPAPPDLVEEVRVALVAAGVPFITPAPVSGPLASVRFAMFAFDPFAVGPDEFDASAPELN